MSTQAIVNYHRSDIESQVYHIDADGIPGNIISPNLDPVTVSVLDVRQGEASVNFQDDSLVFRQSSTSVADFESSSSWKEIYNQELSTLLIREIGAKEVIVFDHTVRVDDPEAERKPARNVHSDYSPDGAISRLIDVLGEEKSSQWSQGHYGFVNVWRPIQFPVISAPLGFVRPRSVNCDDWVGVKLVYPDRIGKIMGLYANNKHEWVFLSNMQPEEVAILNIYDSRGLASIGHSALDLVDGRAAVRKSIESRTLVRY
ncbi:CmcJ/NvfI family oxidoreductase [Sessilibacter corallicola]|uniref:CmcJ/NvfI family oxidoreductase n=1 Tax=Sessilibacter corallicola TaxID=2904075 RepID=A0ABQ0AET3_9GAMM